MEPGARDTLFVACTRPAMTWGVPFEGWAMNGIITYLAFAFVGGGNPLYILLFPAMHFPMVMLADRNPGFFIELRVWFATRAQMIGPTLVALPTSPARGPGELSTSV